MSGPEAVVRACFSILLVDQCVNCEVIVAHPPPSGIRAWDLGSLCNRFIRLSSGTICTTANSLSLLICKANLWDCESIWALMDEPDLLLLVLRFGRFGQATYSLHGWAGSKSPDHEESATAFFP